MAAAAWVGDEDRTLYWVLKCGVCYLDLNGANRFDLANAFKFTSRGSAFEWARKWTTKVRTVRVVRIVDKPNARLTMFTAERDAYRAEVERLRKDMHEILKLISSDEMSPLARISEIAHANLRSEAAQEGEQEKR